MKLDYCLLLFYDPTYHFTSLVLTSATSILRIWLTIQVRIERKACEVTDEMMNEQSQTVEETMQSPSKKLKCLAAVLKKALPIVQPQEQLTTPEKVKKEIDPSCDPMNWWRKEAEYFPALAILARKYLCICRTSVPSERLFSKGGYIVNGLRCRLAPDKVNMLLLLSMNMSLMSEAA